MRWHFKATEKRQVLKQPMFEQPSCFLSNSTELYSFTRENPAAVFVFPKYKWYQSACKLIRKWKSEGAQSCPTFCNPMNCSPPSSSIHWDCPGKSTGVGCHCLLQGGSSQPRDRTWVSSITGRRFYHLRHQGSPRASHQVPKERWVHT